MLCANKQIFSEGRGIYYSENHFHFLNAYEALSFINDIKAHWPMERAGGIEFPFRYVSIRCSRPRHYRNWTTGPWKRLIRAMVKAPHLRLLTLPAGLFKARGCTILRGLFSDDKKPYMTLEFLLQVVKLEDWGALESSSDEWVASVTKYYRDMVEDWYARRRSVSSDFLSDRRFEHLWERHARKIGTTKPL